MQQIGLVLGTTPKKFMLVSKITCQNYAPKFSIWHQGHTKKWGGAGISSLKMICWSV